MQDPRIAMVSESFREYVRDRIRETECPWGIWGPTAVSGLRESVNQAAFITYLSWGSPFKHCTCRIGLSIAVSAYEIIQQDRGMLATFDLLKMKFDVQFPRALELEWKRHRHFFGFESVHWPREPRQVLAQSVHNRCLEVLLG